MDTNLYDHIIRRIQNYKGLTRNCLEKLQESFPSVSYDTLYSILSTEYLRKMRYSYGRNQSSRNRYWDLYHKGIKNCEEPGILVRLSETYEVAPCLMAKLILQKYCDEHEERNPDKKESLNVNNYLRNTQLIPDPELAREVFLCTIYDNLYSPLANNMKMSLGQQYEIRLHKEAVQLGLAFRTEEYLRKYGYDKTPDLKLDVPVAVDGFVINWIESKALFADCEVHRDYMKNQYLSYWNRFGPGLVIYWFGYLKTITEPSEKRFIIRDNLPAEDIKSLLNIIEPPASWSKKDDMAL
ncbi:CDAN1-interacting nuclease 1 [Anthonomus grandis grandis]|uniref:CDAN1-interacting nuclease 1 n=1 Tax=Anthonomus grandis grandis TaxID=2921223 RepID=UPI002166A7F8|nr:CDAN1-interacting nuclease 1 [Anthonomus grandis grandis]